MMRGKNFAKIPNDFFYNNAKLLHKIGGVDSFLIYCLLTSRKNMANKVHITLKEIIDIFRFVKNTYDCKLRVIDSLFLLKSNNYIDFSADLQSARVNDYLIFNWADIYYNTNKEGWTPFYGNDFDIHSKIGNIPYVVIWILRMHTNNDTGYSFVSIEDMRKMLKCNKNKVQSSVNLFKKYRLFEVREGGYYNHAKHRNKIKMNNQYIYTGYQKEIMDLDKETIAKELN